MDAQAEFAMKCHHPVLEAPRPAACTVDALLRPKSPKFQ